MKKQNHLIENENYIVAALKAWKEDEFVPLVFDSVRFYGGFQDWLTKQGVSQFYANRSCAVTAAANMMCYLAVHQKNKYQMLYPAATLSPEGFNQFQKRLYEVFRPTIIGIPLVTMMIKRIMAYANVQGISLQAIRFTGNWKEENVANFIQTALQEDYPVLLLTWNTAIKELAYHWVVVTKLYGSVGDIKILTSNWGKIKEYSLSEWVKGFSFYKGLVYFR